MLLAGRSIHQSWIRHFASLPEHLLLTMPALSPTMTQGNIASWTLQEGAKIEAGSSICEVETDKATVDYEAQDDGFLAKIVMPAGSQNVQCGTVIGISVEDEADIPAFANYVPPSVKSEAAVKKPPAAEKAPVVKETPPVKELLATKTAPPSAPAKPSNLTKLDFPKLKSPLAPLLSKSHSDFEAQYGSTLMTREIKK